MVLELKSVETLLPIHEAQLLTYMKILKAPCGILINFNCTNIVKQGKRPFVNDLYKTICSENNSDALDVRNLPYD